MRLRDWQAKAIELVKELHSSGRDRALIAACPGAGKTAFAVSLLKQEPFVSAVDMIVVVGPTRVIKRQWSKAFRAEGIGTNDSVGNDALQGRAYADELMFDPARPVHVHTYSQIASNPELFAIMCARHRVFVILDEVHHAAEDQCHGDSLVLAFEGALFKLSLSGTPFNTKGKKLAFCEIEQATDAFGNHVNKTVTDFEYSYGDALKSCVVRPVQFHRWNGFAKWRQFDVVTGEERNRVFTGANKTDILSPLVDMDCNYAKKMLDAAVTELDSQRKHQSNAGMLIAAMSVEHCQQIVDYLQSKGVRDVTTITHDTPAASEKIEQWARSNDRIVVAVKMISEGIDIKRLRIGVYLSSVLTQMFFSQFVGRFVRWDGSLDGSQHARVFIPEHVTLMKYAAEIEKMVDEAIETQIIHGPTPPPPPPRFVLLGKESDGDQNGTMASGQQMEQSDYVEIAKILTELGLKGVIKEIDAQRIIDAGRGKSADSRSAETASDDIQGLNRENDRLVGAIVSESERRGGGWSYAEANSWANREVGIRRKDTLTPEATLRQRSEALKRLLLSIRAGRPPAWPQPPETFA